MDIWRVNKIAEMNEKNAYRVQWPADPPCRGSVPAGTIEHKPRRGPAGRGAPKVPPPQAASSSWPEACLNLHVAGSMLGTWAGLECDYHMEIPTPRRVPWHFPRERIYLN